MLASALFLLASCSDDEEELNLGFAPEDTNINLAYTELTLPYEVVLLDSINTTNTNTLLIGAYRDPDFGLTDATAYLNLNISGRSTADADDQLDSLTLSLVNSYYYGASGTGMQELSVYRLNEVLEDTLTYFNNQSLGYNSTPIGTISFDSSPGVNASTDTLRIRLNDALGNEFLSKLKAGDPEMDSSALFRQYFNGLAIRGSSEKPFITGFNSPEGLRMRMYFSAPGDTASKVFTFGPFRGFNGYAYDRSGTALAGLNEPGDVVVPTDNRFYLQSGTGIIPRVDFRVIEDFVANNEQRILLNRVSLRIGLPPAREGSPYPDALRGFLVEDNELDLTQLGVDRRGNTILSGVYVDEEFNYNRTAQLPLPAPPTNIIYDSLAGNYELKISSFLQTVVDGYEEKSQALFYPNDLRSGMSQIVTEADSVRLRVYYTTLD